MIGAGASGTEVASAFRAPRHRGAAIEALEQILPLEDKEIANLRPRDRQQNVRIETGAKVEGAEAWTRGSRSASTARRSSTMCIAAGRAPDVEGLGLDEAGIKRDDKGLIEVDGRLRLEGGRLGDRRHGPRAGARPQASDEGIIAVEDAAGLEPDPIDYRFVPAVTFCHPQVASFGLTEQEAREGDYDVVVGKVPLGAVGAPTVYGDRSGMIKIVGDKKYGELLGGHIVSVKAAD